MTSQTRTGTILLALLVQSYRYSYSYDTYDGTLIRIQAEGGALIHANHQCKERNKEAELVSSVATMHQ